MREKEKSCIRETLKLSTCADSSTNTKIIEKPLAIYNTIIFISKITGYVFVDLKGNT